MMSPELLSKGQKGREARRLQMVDLSKVSSWEDQFRKHQDYRHDTGVQTEEQSVVE